MSSTCARTTVTLFCCSPSGCHVCCCLDEVEQEDMQLCIQHVAATMSVIISANQELTDDSGEDDDHDDHDDNGTDKKKH